MEMNIPLTIEKQLENYSIQTGHTDRHETLWHAWYQNKRWISQLLQVTLSSFPTYSRHDETHALSVLNNIEMILGQERIAQLSATDCFVLLHTVYLHDIGMCITQQDRKDIIENEAFMEMVDRLEADGDESIIKAIKILKCADYGADSNGKEERVSYLKQLYRAKLDVYYAIIELMAHYRRSEHGEKSRERLYEWTLKSDKLGTGFSMAGVPLRIFLAIARSGQMHTCDNFEEISQLPRKDGGYASDYYHPRFISVLLMLGDLLDMDNDRFHPMVFDFVEEFPEISRNHYDKHRAIRRLNISPDAIEIEADCQNQNALRLVRKECDMLVDILRNAGYIWTSICPEGFRGSLPSLKEVNLYLKGKKIPEELVTAQFVISQKKAFSILEGSNLYDGRFVFLREFLQNAIDATKMQYWYDYMGTAAYYYSREEAQNKSPNDMNSELALDKYPIEIEMKIQKKDEEGKIRDVEDDDIKQIKNGHPGKYEYGVLVSVKDFGTGIDKESIIAISKVGNSRLKDKKIIQKMPQWLRPTAEFGVGLQSAFLLTGNFKASTYTRSGERYEITFNSGASTQYEGYINVVPIIHFDGKRDTYGTRFDIFVPLNKKYLHSESIYTWSGSDPFSQDYDNTRILRHAAELISQMVLYLDGILGEVLFPIKLKVNDQGVLDLAINRSEENQIHKIQYQLIGKVECEKEKSWIFRENEDRFYWGNMANASFALEYDTSRLYIWAKDVNAFCVVSGVNLIKQETRQGKRQTRPNTPRGVMIFYKGIQLQCKCVDEIEIFDFIDIKGSLERSFINISRRGLTAEGEKYFEDEVYRKLLGLVKEVLKFINKNNTSLDKLSKNICEKIDNGLLSNQEKEAGKKLNAAEYHERLVKLAEQLVSLALLSHLAVKDINDEFAQLGKAYEGEEVRVWQNIINEVNGCLRRPNNKKILKELGKYSVLFQIQGYECLKTYTERTFTVLDLFSDTNHFGILQRRDNPLDTWTTYIISIENAIYSIFERRMLSELSKLEKIEDLDKQIEDWWEKICIKSEDIGVTVPDNNKYQQQFLLTWLLQNIPTIGMFCDKDKVRFNVLGDYIYPYIYTNRNHKRQIVEKILKTAVENNYNRFSTYAWQGSQYLSVEDVPFSCFFTKRGYLNKSSMYKVIIPIEGAMLCNIQRAIEQVEDLEFVKNMKLLAEMLDFKDYFRKLMDKESLTEREREIREMIQQHAGDKSYTSVALNIDEFYQDYMRSMANEQEQSLTLPETYFTTLRASEREWYEYYLEVIEAYIDEYIFIYTGINTDEGKVSNLKYHDMFPFILKGWWFKNNINSGEVLPHLQTKKLKEDYLQRCENDVILKMTNQRIIQYIMKNGRYHLKQEQIEQCFYAFIKEIFEVAEELENEMTYNILISLR